MDCWRRDERGWCKSKPKLQLNCARLQGSKNSITRNIWRQKYRINWLFQQIYLCCSATFWFSTIKSNRTFPKQSAVSFLIVMTQSTAINSICFPVILQAQVFFVLYCLCLVYGAAFYNTLVAVFGLVGHLYSVQVFRKLARFLTQIFQSVTSHPYIAFHSFSFSLCDVNFFSFQSSGYSIQSLIYSLDCDCDSFLPISVSRFLPFCCCCCCS